MLTRRMFIKIIPFAATLPAVLTTLPARAKKVALSIAKIDALKKVGGSTTLKIKGKKVLFIRDGDQSIKAVDPICTHRQCVVVYKPEKKIIECPCHSSAYQLDGKNIFGPAPKPLKTYKAKLKKDKIILDLD